MEARRRRRVPAFGEWNYYCYSGQLSTPAPATAEWFAPAAETTEACSDVWFRYSPPARKPPPPPRRKAIRRQLEATNKSYGGDKRRVQAAATPSNASTQKAARAPAKAATATARVVRSVDADLYRVPPPDFEPDEPRRGRKKACRSAWMACFGFSCCVA